MSIKELEQGLLKVQQLATANKLQRLWHSPVNYISAQFFRTIVFPISKKGVLKQATTFTGYPLSTALPSGMDIYLTGGKTHDSEIRLARFLIQFYKNSSINPVFIDIGAHVGYFSLLVSCIMESLNLKGKVYSFEAAQGTFELLKVNLKPHDNIQVFHNALTDIETDLEFFEFPVLYSEYNTLHVQQFENEAWFKRFKPIKNVVKGRALDSIITDFSIQNPLIKVDTEGAEEQVIKGGIAFLKEQNPTLILEFLADSSKNEGHFKAFDILKDSGYIAHFIKMDGSLEVLKDIKTYFNETQLDSDNFVFIKG